MHRLRSYFALGYQRARELPPARVDAYLAAGFALWALIESAVWGLSALEIVGLTAMMIPIAWRRTRPEVAAPASITILILTAVASGKSTDSTAAFFSLFVLIYSAGAHVRDRRALARTIALTAGLLTIALVLDSSAEDLPFVYLVVIGGPLLAGRAVRSRIDMADALRDRTARLEKERGLHARAAAEAERARIATELQDVVSHRVSAMVVQTGAARRLARERPHDALAAIAAVETTGREALAEMRLLLGVLRRGDEDLALAPQPTLERVGDLVARVREEGQPVELRIEGEHGVLTPGVDVAAYRVVQEALAGAARHAPGAATTVALRYGRRELELEVSDAGDADGERLVTERDEGAGGELLGMRERVELFGGELRAGPRRGGGYSVRARLPLGEQA